MARLTPHVRHQVNDSRCPACRWRALSEGDKEAHRERGRAQWRANNPEKAAARDAILAGRSPEPCDRCGAGYAIAFVSDYERGQVVWRCSPCEPPWE
jgi:hypothetical protein